METTNSHRLNGSWKIFETLRYFYRPLIADMFHDPFKNIQLQTIIGACTGYKLVNKKRTEWYVSPGLAALYTRFDSVKTGERNRQSSPAFVLTSDFKTELTRTRDFYT